MKTQVTRQTQMQRASPLPERVIQQLRAIYASETTLALELEVLFRRTGWVPLRLVLSDQRRETSRHVERLACIIAMVDWRVGPTPDRASASRANGGQPGQLPAGAIVAGPLRAARAAVAAYGSVIAAANEHGLAHVANLLASSLAEESATTERLAVMVAEISNQ